MDFIRISGTECDGIWGGNLGMGRKEELENVKLRKMVIQVRVLHAKISNKGTEDE